MTPAMWPWKFGRWGAWLCFAGMACMSTTTGSDTDEPPLSQADLVLVPVADGLDRPLLAVSPPGDPRLFIVEQPGRIRVMVDGSLVPTPFLEITDRVGCCGERGLLGLAFDPDFRATERFFVSYTDRSGTSRLEGFRGVDRGNVANPTTGQLYLQVEQPFGNHNGGHIAFGQDQKLYVALGDGGSGGDPLGNGQNAGTLLGAILRIDVTGSIGPPYAIPPDNPFVDSVGVRPEVWHFGLRNPWRFSFDPDGEMMYIGDVGQNRWEEINVVGATAGGLNFGWSTMEGHECFAGACEADGLRLPTAVYSHDDGCSVTGGFVYRGQSIPALVGRYFYADYCAGWIRTFRLAANGTATDPQELAVESPGRITSFGQDSQGEIYVVVESGTVFRIEAR